MYSVESRLLLAALLRSDLTAFLQKVFATVSPKDTYLPNWHIEAITYELRRCLSADNTRLLITQPPRSLKSIAASVALVAWALGHNPKLRFICVSYSQELATEFTRQFRLVVNSEWYRLLFPKMRLAKDTGTECVTTQGGGRIATSVGGTITGRGADIIIIDDPMKAEDAASEATRAAVMNWYTTMLLTRLNDKERGAIVVVMQRLHEDDLAGHLLLQGGWHHLDLPVIAVDDQFVRTGPHPNDIHHRREGDVLHPKRESRATLARIKAEIGSLMFSAQYQQRPIPLEGNLIKRDWFKIYDEAPSPGLGIRIVQSWDIAATVGGRRDWSVCTTWAMQRKIYYLLDVWRGQLEYPQLKRKVIALQAEYNARTVLIEKAGLGLNLVQDLSANSPIGFPNPIRITPQGDKATRMEAESAGIEAGHVALPRNAPWLDDFLRELLAFPNGRHDDQVDSVSQFLLGGQAHGRPPPTPRADHFRLHRSRLAPEKQYLDEATSLFWISDFRMDAPALNRPLRPAHAKVHPFQASGAVDRASQRGPSEGRSAPGGRCPRAWTPASELRRQIRGRTATH